MIRGNGWYIRVDGHNYLGSFSRVTISSSSSASCSSDDECDVFPISRSTTSTSGSFVMSTLLASLFSSCWSRSLEDRKPRLLRRLLRRPSCTRARVPWIAWRSLETSDPFAKSLSSIVFFERVHEHWVTHHLKTNGFLSFRLLDRKYTYLCIILQLP